MSIGAEVRWYASRVVGTSKAALQKRVLQKQAASDIAHLADQLSFDSNAEVTVLMGPCNTAGAAREWMRIADSMPGVSARSVRAEAVGRGTFNYQSDVVIPRSAEFGDLTSWKKHVADSVSTVIFESCKPLLGSFTHGDFREDVQILEDAGIRTAVLMHGSDVRDELLHQKEVHNSLFAGVRGPYWRAVSKQARRNRKMLNSYDGIKFVSTPGLVTHVPGSRWLPLVVDIPRFHSERPILERDRPIVAHAPSNPLFKGTADIEPVLHKLESEGLLTYRRIQGIPHTDMPAFIEDADIVIDQVTLGDTGVQIAETMAAGRLAIANIAPLARKNIGRDIPVVQADPSTLENVLRHVLSNRQQYIEVASTGPEYVRDIHDGRRAQRVLAESFGWTI